MLIRLFDYGDADRVANEFSQAATTAHPRRMRTAFLKIGAEMRLVETAIFRSSGRRGGGSWKRLKEDTIRKKGDSRILFTRDANAGYSSIGGDALYKSLTKKDDPYHIFNIVQYELEFGTSRPNAWVHEEGYPPQGIPARPFLKFTQRDIDGYKAILLNHMVAPFVNKTNKGKSVQL